MIKPKRLPRDPNQRAFQIVRLLTGQETFPVEPVTEPDPFVEFGAQGGKARAKSLSAKKRKEIAQKAAKARWKKKRTSHPE